MMNKETIKENILVLPCLSAHDHNCSFALNKQEQKYLSKKQSISICIDPHWMPYDALSDGKHAGINSYFLASASKKLGIPIEVLPTKNWQESLSLVKEHQCDLLSLSGITLSRKSYLRFTEPYFDIMIILATIGDEATSIDILALEDEPIGIVSNHTYVHKIEIEYPHLNLIKFKTLEDALNALQKNKIEILIENLPTIVYEIQQGNYDELNVSGTLKEQLQLGFGVRSDDEMLFNIMQKISQSFDLQQKQESYNRWLIARYKEEVKKSQEKDRILFEHNKLIAMGEMIENISHQWRQPLAEINASVILIDNQLDKDGVINSNIEQELSRIEHVTKYMSRTIDDFRYFYSNGKEKTHCDLQESLRFAISIIEASLQFHEITLEVNNSICLGVKAFSNELQQVIIIILNNAKDVLVERQIKGAKITVDFIVTNGQCTLSIFDNAGGIIPENINRIFEPYFTTKHQSKGTGLGLYIAKKIITEMNGVLLVSNNSSGACFQIELKISENHGS